MFTFFKKGNIARRLCQVIIYPFLLYFVLLSLISSKVSIAADNPSKAYWVFFDNKESDPLVSISTRAVQRRQLRSGINSSSLYDLPVSKDYILAIKNSGAKIRTISRWLNGVSVEASDSVIQVIAGLPFITNISRVSSYYSRPLPELVPGGNLASNTTAFNYGPSFAQISMLSIDSLHNQGLSGAGVMIGIMDTGFDTSLSVFGRMRAQNHVIYTYDFINGDSNVVDQFNIQRQHGTAVLSVIGGFSEGDLIGPAFNSEFILAKTEIVNSEQHVEEDHWVAACEWMESLGVDIISSSLGYIDWYDTTQLDGQTAVITRAANIAYSLGVIVVNSAGNERGSLWEKIIPPADGDSVIAVGAVDFAGNIAAFSSRGPTADGRIKPNFCAMGVSDYAANYQGGYGYYSGTSFSAPLIAGGIALLLEGHPEWKLSDIFSVLKNASSKKFLPDNLYGWGIPNFVDAFYSQPYQPNEPLSLLIAPHPAEDSTIFYITSTITGGAYIDIFDVSGVQVKSIKFQIYEPTTIKSVWDGKNEAGKKVASGIYLVAISIGNDILRDKFFLKSR